MFWPKGRKRYENLKTSFTNLEGLVDDLVKSGFNGFIEIEMDPDPFYILVEQGYPIKIYTKETDTGKFSLNHNLSIKDVHEKTKTTLSIINVFDVDPERINLLLSYLDATPLYTNLSSEFTDFDRLTQKLSRDNLIGYLETKFKDISIDSAYIFYNKGKVEDVFWGEQQHENPTAGLERLNEKIQKNEAQFNVYQSRPLEKAEMLKAPMPEAGEGQQARNEGEEKQEKVANDVNIAMEEVSLDERLEIELPELKEEEEKKEEELDNEKEEEEGPEKEEYILETLPIKPYLEFTGALLKWVEAAVNKQIGKGYFSRAFKKGLLNISDRYPFLDPFLAEFSYVDGKVQFNIEAKALEFLKGIYTAVDSVLEELTEKERGEVKKILGRTLPALEKRHHEEIEILRVRTLMPSLFQ